VNLKEFYCEKKVLVTGHTGFKGAWLCRLLHYLGAEIVGYALEPPTDPSLYNIAKIDEIVKSYIGDIRDLNELTRVFKIEQPEIVIHMAAQPIVRESYIYPVETYEINVMGTVNVLEACRRCNSVKSIVNVTTDKVYRNVESERGYVETDELCGFDPYSNSKSCSELVTDSYRNSFLNSLNIPVSTVRAGNVIGGGDFAKNRIIPDCIRSIIECEDIIVRNPFSVRPYQHVLEPLLVYLIVAMEQYENMLLSSSYNVGPHEKNCVTTGELVTLFCDIWNEKNKTNIGWLNHYDGGPHEAGYLKLNSNKLANTFGWEPRWQIVDVLDKIVSWTKTYLSGEDVRVVMDNQIKEFICFKDEKI